MQNARKEMVAAARRLADRLFGRADHGHRGEVKVSGDRLLVKLRGPHVRVPEAWEGFPVDVRHAD
jgi:hypothetical protein